ncbi:MAG TPA: lytic transglycosylase domain-containing protein [Bryobacteraceae bacterium]|nr:lytic transglycosylase domain-containing protein [Bryobacteraceae bacterium]
MTAVVNADARTGRLVRNIVMEPKFVRSQPPAPASDIHTMVDRIASENGVENNLVHSVIRAESNYDPNAVSPKGAQGLMQLIPSTAKRFGVSNTFDPAENILGGVRYLRFLLDYYQGDYAKTIAAYNAGEGAVDKYKGIPPYIETRNYVYQVAKNLKTARESPTAAPAIVSPAPVASTTDETPRPIETSIGSDGRVYYRTLDESRKTECGVGRTLCAP